MKNHSRHIYDIYKLLPLVPQDKAFCELVREVRAVRKLSMVCPSAQDGMDVQDLLRKIIKEAVYKADYQILTERILEEKLSYETAIQAIDSIANSDIF